MGRRWVVLVVLALLRPGWAQLPPGLTDLRRDTPAKPVPGYGVKLVLDRQSYELGTPIDVTLVHTYTGQQPLWAMPVADTMGLAHADLRFVAFDSRNRPVERRHVGDDGCRHPAAHGRH